MPGPDEVSQIPRMVDGISGKLDRVAVIGNGQVPAVVAKVWERLTQ